MTTLYTALAALAIAYTLIALGVRIGRRTIKPITKFDLQLAAKALRSQEGK